MSYTVFIVDEHLSFQAHPLSTLFLDCNSFFASVEEQENPDLRGKPVIVVPVDADSTCAIAASAPAKKLGIKTGTIVGEAKRICPELRVVPARPVVYKAYHEAIRQAAQTVLPEAKVHSIDEMSYGLIGIEREPSEARRLAELMKSRILKKVGSCITCSVGIAPNTFLAKVASEIVKPDGLVILEAKDFPGRLLELDITDLAGINRQMAKRLNAHMIFTSADLCQADKAELRAAFGSIVGERWWYLLRGFTLAEEEREQKSITQSHVLPPELRTPDGCFEVLVRLLTKGLARLRSKGFLASRLTVHVNGLGRRWDAAARLGPSDDTTAFLGILTSLWQGRDFSRPIQVGIGLHDLQTAAQVTPSLFDESPQPRFTPQKSFSKALDDLNGKFGKNSVFVGSSNRVKDLVDEKIAFNKTWLFSEGKGDNDWSAALPRPESTSNS